MTPNQVYRFSIKGWATKRDGVLVAFTNDYTFVSKFNDLTLVTWSEEVISNNCVSCGRVVDTPDWFCSEACDLKFERQEIAQAQ